MHPILKRNKIDWTDVEIKLDSGRQQLQTANTEAEYQAVGLHCREAIVVLGKFVLDARFDGKIKGTSSTDAFEILGKLIDSELPNSSNREMRAYTKACLDLANAIQHSGTSNYAQASVCIEACFTLKNMIRILLWRDAAHPGKGINKDENSNAEIDLMIDCINKDLETHPVAKTNGIKVEGMAYGASFITVHAISGANKYTVTIHKSGWFKGANRVSAAKLLIFN